MTVTTYNVPPELRAIPDPECNPNRPGYLTNGQSFKAFYEQHAKELSPFYPPEYFLADLEDLDFLLKTPWQTLANIEHKKDHFTEIQLRVLQESIVNKTEREIVALCSHIILKFKLSIDCNWLLKFANYFDLDSYPEWRQDIFSLGPIASEKMPPQQWKERFEKILERMESCPHKDPNPPPAKADALAEIKAQLADAIEQLKRTREENVRLQNSLTNQYRDRDQEIDHLKQSYERCFAEQRSSLLRDDATQSQLSELLKTVVVYAEHYPVLACRSGRRGFHWLMSKAMGIAATRPQDFQRFSHLVQVALLREIIRGTYLQLEPFISHKRTAGEVEDYIQSRIRLSNKDAAADAIIELHHFYDLAEANSHPVAERLNLEQPLDRTSPSYRKKRFAEDASDENTFKQLREKDDHLLARWLRALTDYSRLKNDAYSQLLIVEPPTVEPPTAEPLPPQNPELQRQAQSEFERRSQLALQNLGQLQASQEEIHNRLVSLRQEISDSYGVTLS